MSDGHQVGTETPGALPPEIVEELRSYEIAWISDAMDRNLMDPRIRPVHSRAGRIAGPAVTVRIEPGDFLMIPAAMMQTREGDVLVIDGRGDTSRSVWGGYFCAWAQGIGIQGVVIDGATRDAAGIEELGYPVFARSIISRRPTLKGTGEVNVPVSCGGVTVAPGDIVVGGDDGVIVIPRAELASVLEAVRTVAAGERTHHDRPAGDRAAFEAYYEVFAKRMGLTTDRT